ncbi:hypothetical protein [Baaleninema sp.]|uniref:hypothetical protein n=1 Tax=Baaleninema sp. TaxID=3101197 RepID=UPI003D06815E
MSPPCLEEKLHISDGLSFVKDIFNEESGEALQIDDLNYSLINDGIQLQAKLHGERRFVGRVDLEFAQDLLVNLQDGTINLQAGELNVSSPDIPVSLVKSSISQKIEQQIAKIDGKDIEELLSDDDSSLIQDTELDPKVVKLLTEDDGKIFNARFDGESGLILSVGTN